MIDTACRRTRLPIEYVRMQPVKLITCLFLATVIPLVVSSRPFPSVQQRSELPAWQPGMLDDALLTHFHPDHIAAPPFPRRVEATVVHTRLP